MWAWRGGQWGEGKQWEREGALSVRPGTGQRCWTERASQAVCVCVCAHVEPMRLCVCVSGGGACVHGWDKDRL